MEIERLIKLDEEAILLEEDIPLVRSLSMSRNMALSMLEEVPHMIKLPNEEENDGEITTTGNGSGYVINRSASSSSLGKGNKTNIWGEGERRISIECNSSMEVVGMCRPVSFNSLEDPDMIRTMGMEGFSVVESRSALTQVAFPSTVRGVKKNDLLTGIVVSRWDNIVGPQCCYLWTEEVTSVFYPDPSIFPPSLSGVVKYVTDHTVDHQDVDGHSHSLTPSTQRTTLCIVPDLSLIYIAISIRVPSEMDTILEFASSSSMTANDPDQPATSIPHAVAVLADLKFLPHFLLLRPLIVNWLNEFAPKIGVLICKNKLQSSMINSWCAELCKTMTALKTCWVQEEKVSCSGSESSSNKKLAKDNNDKVIHTNGHYNKNMTNLKKLPQNVEGGHETNSLAISNIEMEYLPPNLRHVSKSSWGILLTAHLSAYGSSIIVGFDSLAVNQVIRFLLCFSSNQEGYCSRYSLATLPDTFMKGLLIQGLTLGGIGQRSMSYNQVASNKLPLTYVELGSKFKVKQTNPQIHRQVRSNILMQELRALWTSSSFISPLEEPYTIAVNKAAGFVTQFLEDLSLLSNERRYGRLLLFRRLLHVKAMTVITYLHSIRELPKSERIKLCRQIPETFGYDEQEYAIIQITAEKLKPGIVKQLYF